MGRGGIDRNRTSMYVAFSKVDFTESTTDFERK